MPGHATSARWDVGQHTLSGLESIPPGTPRATILALHGGGYSAGYWDHPLDPSASLLRVGADLGYRVIAIDRPGYGASHGLVGDKVRATEQVAILRTFLDQLMATGDIGAGVFLIGHSQGSVISIHLAAVDHRPALLGMEIAGLPLEFRGELVDREVLAGVDYLPDNPWEFRRNLFYGPTGTFDPAIATAEEDLIRPIPAAEIIDAADCPTTMPVLMPQVTIPVQYTVAEYEASSDGGRAVLDHAAALLGGSPRVVLQWQEGSAHDISLHRVARAYHLRAIAFFDEVLTRAVAPQGPRP